MTKHELITAVSEKAGFTKKDVGQVVDAITLTISETLAAGDDVKITGFGNFSILERGERVGRNPQDGTPIKIAASKLPKFKPSQVLKEAVK